MVGDQRIAGATPPASPMPTPMRARNSCQKSWPMPHRAVNRLQSASASGDDPRSSLRSAKRAIGIAERRIERARRRCRRSAPSWESVRSRSSLIGSARMPTICRSRKLKRVGERAAARGSSGALRRATGSRSIQLPQASRRAGRRPPRHGRSPKPIRSTSPRTSVMQFCAFSACVPALRVRAAEGEEARVRRAVERIEQLGLGRARCRRSRRAIAPAAPRHAPRSARSSGRSRPASAARR